MIAKLIVRKRGIDHVYHDNHDKCRPVWIAIHAIKFRELSNQCSRAYHIFPCVLLCVAAVLSII